MGWLDSAKDALFGSEGSIDWDELRKLMSYEGQLNKVDRGGPFTGWAWEDQRDAEGNIMYDENGQVLKSNTQSMRINPDFQPAVDRLGERATGTSPMMQASMNPQMQGIFDASMKNQMARYGVPPAPPPGNQPPPQNDDEVY
ncbi:MAG: hypothetical protein DRI24_11565 [Deltaproteobacteria bacterium]|nr:MAG: hypothetical protein DRI24_11565 [Deltaproteobacteria bacterium]